MSGEQVFAENRHKPWLSEPFITEEEYWQLAARLDADMLYRRLRKEWCNDHLVKRRGIQAFFEVESRFSFHNIVRWGFRASLLHHRAQRNAYRIQVRENHFYLNNLPAAFDGYRILHLSDLHLDLTDDLVPALIQTVQGLRYDACVMTGDYRARLYGPRAAAIDGMAKLMHALNQPVFGVFGNHDSIFQLPAFEIMGLKVLMNETMLLERDGAVMNLAGVDDPHSYHTDDLSQANSARQADTFSILLVHSPEFYREAAESGYDILLCGHTHGGQICLPGGRPLVTNVNKKCPLEYVSGNWRYDKLLGYTSVGAGASGVDLRLNCYPEVTIHTLRCRKARG